MNWSGASGAATSLPYSGLTPSLTAPAVRGNVQGTSGGGSSITYAYPTGTRRGDVCLVIQNGGTFTPLASTPAPWCQVDSRQAAGGSTDYLAAHVVQDEGALGHPSAIVTVSSTFVGTMVVLGGTPAGLIIMDQEASAIAADGATATSPTITTTQPNEICLILAEHGGSPGAISLSGPSGITLIKQGNGQVIGSFPMPAAGLTTAVTLTDAHGTTGVGWAMFVCSFMPVGN